MRLETYESEKYQNLTRSLLNGKLANTTFAILDPNNQKPLSRVARSPQMAFGASDWKSDTNADMTMVYSQLAEFTKQYPNKANQKYAVTPDFHSFSQALNVTSADQRLLVFTVAAKTHRDSHKEKLEAVANHPDVIGRFHYDFAESNDAEWSKQIDGDSEKTGYFILRANEFGLTGTQIKHLPLSTSTTKLRSILLTTNRQFSANEAPKNYIEHKRKGAELGITYNSPVPFGVDKDKDGEIDPPRERKKRR